MVEICRSSVSPFEFVLGYHISPPPYRYRTSECPKYFGHADFVLSAGASSVIFDFQSVRNAAVLLLQGHVVSNGKAWSIGSESYSAQLLTVAGCLIAGLNA